MAQKPRIPVPFATPAPASVPSTAAADAQHIPFIDLQAQRHRLGHRIEAAMEKVFWQNANKVYGLGLK